MAFKMKKGSPMERNFGISPMKKEKMTKLEDHFLKEISWEELIEKK